MTFSLATRIASTFGVFALFVCPAGPRILGQDVKFVPLADVASPASPSSFVASPNSGTTALPETPIPDIDGQKASAQYSMPGPEVDITAKYVPAGYHAQNLNAHQKMVVGLRDLYTPTSFLGNLYSAGYSHVANGQPNYGTDSGAFGQRVGASFARNISEGVFSDVLLAPLLHEDPRYYVRDPEHNFANRMVYAITRPIITRNDQGRSTVNGSQLLGYAGAAALSVAYAPQINRNARDVASSYAGSIGGEALGFLYAEFAEDIFQTLHIHHRSQH